MGVLDALQGAGIAEAGGFGGHATAHVKVAESLTNKIPLPDEVNRFAIAGAAKMRDSSNQHRLGAAQCVRLTIRRLSKAKRYSSRSATLCFADEETNAGSCGCRRSRASSIRACGRSKRGMPSTRLNGSSPSRSGRGIRLPWRASVPLPYRRDATSRARAYQPEGFSPAPIGPGECRSREASERSCSSSTRFYPSRLERGRVAAGYRP